MREETSGITIGFHYVDTMGNTYDSSSTVEVFFDLGDTELSVIGDQLNTFLRQCGYMRRHDTIMMTDVDEDELDMLEGYLAEIRAEKEAAKKESHED